MLADSENLMMLQTCEQVRRINRRSRRTVTLIAVVTSLAGLSHLVLGDDQPTPSPTPLYLRPLARPGSVRRMEQLARQRTLEAESQSRASARAQARENRRATATAHAQAREAARERERARREVDAEGRRESARATPRPTSDLMKRMGFSEQEIAAQKALEGSTKAEASPTASPAKK